VDHRRQRRWATTDFMTEQSLEVEGPRRSYRSEPWQHGERWKRKRVTNGEKATGHGNMATAVVEGKASKGVRCEEGAPKDLVFGPEPAADPKRGGPHGRLQGAINLHGVEWSKPS